MNKKYKYTTARQVGGDDGYCWAVFVNGVERINGLTKREVPYYRDRWEREEDEKRRETIGNTLEEIVARVNTVEKPPS